MRAAPELQAATDCSACVADPQRHQPPPAGTRHSPQGAAPRHGEGGHRRRRTAAPHHTASCRTRPGPNPADDRPAAAAPHDTSPDNNNRSEEREYPVVSNWPLHRVMQQRCHHVTSASAQSQSWQPMPRPRLQQAATARREKVQLRIREQSFHQRRGLRPRIIQPLVSS